MIDGIYRAFMLLLVLLGASSAVYTASILLETLVEGTLNDGFRRRRMLHQVDKMRGHVIVAGCRRPGVGGVAVSRRPGLCAGRPVQMRRIGGRSSPRSRPAPERQRGAVLGRRGGALDLGPRPEGDEHVTRS